MFSSFAAAVYIFIFYIVYLAVVCLGYIEIPSFKVLVTSDHDLLILIILTEIITIALSISGMICPWSQELFIQQNGAQFFRVHLEK